MGVMIRLKREEFIAIVLSLFPTMVPFSSSFLHKTATSAPSFLFQFICPHRDVWFSIHMRQHDFFWRENKTGVILFIFQFLLSACSGERGQGGRLPPLMFGSMKTGVFLKSTQSRFTSVGLDSRVAMICLVSPGIQCPAYGSLLWHHKVEIHPYQPCTGLPS